MILIDLNQIIVSAIMAQVGRDPNINVDEGLVRHTVINNLRACIHKFKREYGPEVVVCCDAKSKTYWRKDVFPHYKYRRHNKAKENLQVNWHEIFKFFNQVKLELKEVFPYKILEVEFAEADDIIATLTIKYSAHEKILIFSNDKDFGALQKFPNVKQFSQYHDRFIKVDDPAKALKEHIIRGDSGDDVPNFLSPDDSFVTGTRQKSINSKKLEVWLTQEPKVFCQNDNQLRWFKRNELLIDLEKVPQSISEKIIEAYDTATVGSKSKLLHYFMEKKLISLVECLGEF